MEETKWCPGVDRDRHEVPVEGFYKNVSRDDGLSPLCVSCHSAEAFKRRVRTRLEAIELLGGRCQSPTCAVLGGMTDQRALQFDHIEGGGNKRQRDGENGYQIIKAILAGSTDFQLLCANCNWIKKAERMEWVGDREYNRIAPTQKVWKIGKGVGRGKSEAGQRGLTSSTWRTMSEEDRNEILVKRSAARREAREARVVTEAGQLSDPSWEAHGLESCADCGTRVRPWRSKGMCNTCYVREYSVTKRGPLVTP